MGPQPSRQTTVEPTVEQKIAIAGGLELYAEQWVPEGAPRAAVVLVHGFSAHCGNYRHVAQAFVAAGVAALLFDCRGHGRSPGRRGHIERFTDFTDDLDAVLAAARAAWPGVPLIVLGHSHGATIALDYLLSGRGSIDALVVAAPYLALQLKVPAVKLHLSKLMGRVWPTLTLGNGLRPKDVSRNPEVWASMENDPLIHHVATPRWFNEVRAAQARIIQAADKLKTPTLMLLAGEDRIVISAVALAFAQAAGPLVTVKQYENLFHEMFLEPERDVLIGDIVRWVAKRLPA
jgi:alpha-beta hydrolase superfamily lysophospholipase